MPKFAPGYANIALEEEGPRHRSSVLSIQAQGLHCCALPERQCSGPSGTSLSCLELFSTLDQKTIFRRFFRHLSECCGLSGFLVKESFSRYAAVYTALAFCVVGSEGHLNCVVGGFRSPLDH